MSKGYEELVQEEARLVILRLLAEENDHRMNSSMLQDILNLRYGIAKPRHWVHQELRYLAGLSAIHVTDSDTILVAELRQRGLDHVRRVDFLEGVKRPSPKA